jgi:pyruvate dehydrogenase E2 component (dihydrolipoamide acetyltransferase)
VGDFVMPSLGADMEAGRLVEWLVAPGARVRRGDVVAVVETQKGAIEIEIFEDGTVEHILVPVGREVTVGTVLARIAGGGGASAAPTAAARPQPEPPPAAPPTPPASVAAGPRVRITPAARRRAEALGIDARGLAGTGVEGAVRLADIDAAASAAATLAPRPAPRGGFDPVQMRRAIAAAMARSKREIPHYYLTDTIDLSRGLARLEAANRDRPPVERLLPAALLLRASARALAAVPALNGFWEGEGFRPGPGIHVGWAIALRGGGLVAPAIHDADRLSLAELMAAMRDLVQRARSGGLRSSELSDPTVTVTSLGERGAQAVLAIIQPPQVASIGFGRIALRPWVADGTLVVRPLVSVSLAGDHRASDGHMGGRLLAEIDRLLQDEEVGP